MHRFASLAFAAAVAPAAVAGIPTSTLEITDGTFEITNFDDSGVNPLSVSVLFNSGTYDLNLEEGDFELVFSGAFEIDTDEDGVADDMFVLDAMSLGVFEVNAPFGTDLSGSATVPPFPPLEINGQPLNFGGLNIDYSITTGNPDLSGAFGAGAGIFLTVTGDNLGGVEDFLTGFDPDSDNSIRVGFSGTIIAQLVPVPSTVLAFGVIGVVAARRRR